MNTIIPSTKEVIIGMLKENTGRHFLDSGGAYGRRWERNQTRDFEKEPACKVDCSVWFDKQGQRQTEVLIYYNLFHYLNNFLEYDEVCERLNKAFTEFCNTPDYKEEAWETCQEAWVKTQPFKVRGSAYTYNFDTLLDQDIVYVDFEYEGDDYIFLRIHGGCDARGGFTKPVIFRVSDFDYFILAQNDCYAYVKLDSYESQAALKGIEKPPENFSWDSDDGGYHWYSYENDGAPKLKDVLDVNDNEEPIIHFNGKEYKVEFSVMESY